MSIVGLRTWWSVRRPTVRAPGRRAPAPSRQPSERILYAVNVAHEQRDIAVLACAAVLEILRPDVRAISVDAYSDFRDQLPAEVEQVQAWLRARGASRRGGDPGMGIELNPGDAEDWRALSVYASWSIHVELDDGDGRGLGTLHDCGRSITAWLRNEQVETLAERIAGFGTLKVIR